MCSCCFLHDRFFSPQHHLFLLAIFLLVCFCLSCQLCLYCSFAHWRMCHVAVDFQKHCIFTFLHTSCQLYRGPFTPSLSTTPSLLSHCFQVCSAQQTFALLYCVNSTITTSSKLCDCIYFSCMFTLYIMAVFSPSRPLLCGKQATFSGET